MRRIATFLVLAGLSAFVLAACGDDADEPADPTTAPQAQTTTTTTRDEPERDEPPARERPAKGTEVVLAGSEFGDMLFDTDDQAIYVFELDTSEESTCYGECAAAWPPVLTDGEPVASRGVDASLLGTTERDDGTVQVTYGGRPLYYYAHEAPGEVRCHNVDLNGGFWWVVGADGEPLA
jgi:predicted lipoprotein with Yx(FWY)xxD motif